MVTVVYAPVALWEEVRAITQDDHSIMIAGRGPEEEGRTASSRSRHPALWFIAGALSVIMLHAVMRGDGSGLSLEGTALGQAISSGGSRGVFAFSGQLTKNSYGIYMVDVDAMTIWVYEYLSRKGCLRLASARTWRYDRYLEDYNHCDLPPDAVEQLIEDQRQYRLRAAERQLP